MLTAAAWFVADSALEGDGFELPVPRVLEPSQFTRLLDTRSRSAEGTDAESGTEAGGLERSLSVTGNFGAGSGSGALMKGSRFAADSMLVQDGFEPSVPGSKEPVSVAGGELLIERGQPKKVVSFTRYR